MADWDTCHLHYANINDLTKPDSRKSSLSSGLSNGNKELSMGDNSSDKGLILHDGETLSQESLTDRMSHSFQNHAFTETNGVSHGPHQTTPRDISSPGTAKAKAAKSPYAPSTIDSIPEEEITIPIDANISSYTKEQISNFLRCLKVDDRIISHLYRKDVDGKRFARLKDSELENVGMKNPVILFFRDKSSSKNKKKSGGAWIL